MSAGLQSLKAYVLVQWHVACYVQLLVFLSAILAAVQTPVSTGCKVVEGVQKPLLILPRTNNSIV